MESSTNLTIALCDDNPEALKRAEQLLQKQLADVPHQFKTFPCAADLLRFAQQHPLRLAVLDIQLPEGNGIQLAQRLLALQPACQVIFLTAYISYCQDVYDVDHIAFVLKEEMDARLPVAVARALLRQKALVPAHAAHTVLTLGRPGAAVQIFQENIRYLERSVRTTWVRTLDDGASTPEKLEKLLEMLDPIEFCQTHKSFAVHWPYVERYEKDRLQMAGGGIVPISRHYAVRVRRSFMAYLAARQQEKKEVLP